VSEFCEACGSYEAHVPGADDGDMHGILSRELLCLCKPSDASSNTNVFCANLTRTGALNP
jgi:hypothetical protein